MGAIPQSRLVRIAASDAPVSFRRLSEYVCTGTDDQQVIVDAITKYGSDTIYEMSPGNFFQGTGTAGTKEIVLDNNMTVRGAGKATIWTQSTDTQTANSNRLFRIEGSSFAAMKSNIEVGGFQVNHLGVSSPFSVRFAKNCKIHDVYGVGPDKDYAGDKSMMVSIREVIDCDFSNLTGFAADNGDAFPNAVWNLIHVVQGCYRCRFTGLRGIRTRSTIDLWGAIDCVFDGFYSYENDEGVDAANSQNCRFENFYIYKSTANAITFKEERGSYTTMPEEYSSGYEYGPMWNTFRSGRIDGYQGAGIGFSSDASTGQSNAQNMHHNHIDDVYITNSIEKDPLVQYHTAIKVGRSGSDAAGQDLYNDGIRITNTHIDVTEGDGIRYNFMHNAVIENCKIYVTDGVALSTVEGSTSDYDSGENNKISNCYFKKSDLTVSASNVCVILQHEKDFSVSNTTIEGGWIGLKMAGFSRGLLHGVWVKDTSGIGIQIQPTAGVDRTANGSVGLVFVGGGVINNDTAVGDAASRAAVEIEASSAYARSNITDMAFIGFGLLDTQGSPTTKNFLFKETGGATIDRVQLVGCYRWDGTAITFPPGDNSFISGQGTLLL